MILVLEEYENSVYTTARVAWIKVLPSGADTAFDVGLQFIDLFPTAMEELKGILE
jgi:hypothetical protein